MATYGIFGTVATTMVQVMQEGVNLQEALIYGATIGVLAGFKNIMKYYFDIDLDLTKFKK